MARVAAANGRPGILPIQPQLPFPNWRRLGNRSTADGRKHFHFEPILCQIKAMPSITLSQLRNTRQLMAWLKAGLTVELRDRKRVIADFIPVIPWPLPDEDAEPKKEGKK